MTKLIPVMRCLIWVVLSAAVAAFCSGCAMREITSVKPVRAPVALQTAEKTDLIDRYNQLANSITSINASVTIQLTAGSSYSGVIEQYHEINGFVLAQKPADIRVIGQVPIVGKNIFDMESDGKVFHIFIPSKSQFLVGPADLERPSSKPIENLRPQHLTEAIFWEPISKGELVLLEETAIPPSSFYILTIVRPAMPNGEARSGGALGEDWEIARKVWFDRMGLDVVRIDNFDSGGKPTGIVRYSNWDMFDAPAIPEGEPMGLLKNAEIHYPRQILLDRPQNDYQLHLTITKLTANETIAPDRFELLQPSGSTIVHIGEADQQRDEQEP